jgi:hypothetical protein
VIFPFDPDVIRSMFPVNGEHLRMGTRRLVEFVRDGRYPPFCQTDAEAILNALLRYEHFMQFLDGGAHGICQCAECIAKRAGAVTR